MDSLFHLPPHHLLAEDNGSRHPTFFQPYFQSTVPLSPPSYSYPHPPTYVQYGYSFPHQSLTASYHDALAFEPISPAEHDQLMSQVHRTITPDRLRRAPSSGQSVDIPDDDGGPREQGYTDLQAQEQDITGDTQDGSDQATTRATTTPLSPPNSLSVRSNITFRSTVDPHLPWRAAECITSPPSEGIQQALVSPFHHGYPRTPLSALPYDTDRPACSTLNASTTADSSASAGSRMDKANRRGKNKGESKDCEGDDESPDSKKRLPGREGQFFCQLQGMLNDESAPRLIYRDKRDNVIIISDAEEFEQKILPNHLNSKQLDSFFRQLHLHGFSRRTEMKRNKKVIYITHTQLKSGLPLTSFRKTERPIVPPTTRQFRHTEQRSLNQAKMSNERLEIDLEVAKAKIVRLGEALGTMLESRPEDSTYLTGLLEGDLPGPRSRSSVLGPASSGTNLVKQGDWRAPIVHEQDVQDVKPEVEGGLQVAKDPKAAESSTAGQAGPARAKKRARKGCGGVNRPGHTKK